MPVVRCDSDAPEHRAKLGSICWGMMAAVARPVGKVEMTSTSGAVAAMQKEWNTIHQKVWDMWEVREKSDVLQEARRENRTIQFGRVYGLCVEKNAELPEGHPNRKFKGRVVFLGNRVMNQDYEAATFADLGMHRRISRVVDWPIVTVLHQATTQKWQMLFRLICSRR